MYLDKLSRYTGEDPPLYLDKLSRYRGGPWVYLDKLV